MAILTLGVSFRRAPIELLERLSFAEDDLPKAYRHALDAEGVNEAVILSTCNRVEVHADVTGYHPGFLALKRLFVEAGGIHPDELAEPLYSHWEQDAADHLFSVAAGLDSMVLGETQIHAQVREALRQAEAEEAAGPVLTGLFHAAIRTGRRVRGETTLGAAPDVFASVGATLAEEVLGSLEGRRVVIVGAGQMAALSVKRLRLKGAGTIRILNRSRDHARALAERMEAEHGPLEGLAAALADADLLVSATGAVGTMVSAESVRSAMASRPERPLVLVDLAVPRDVDPGCDAVSGVHRFDISALRSRLSEVSEETAAGIARAHEIVGEEVHRFAVRRRGDALAPLIKALRRRGEDVVASELGRHGSRLQDLTPDEHAAVESLARGIAAKLLHDPIVELKERSEPGTEGRHAKALAELLGIDVPIE